MVLTFDKSNFSNLMTSALSSEFRSICLYKYGALCPLPVFEPASQSSKLFVKAEYAPQHNGEIDNGKSKWTGQRFHLSWTNKFGFLWRLCYLLRGMEHFRWHVLLHCVITKWWKGFVTVYEVFACSQDLSAGEMKRSAELENQKLLMQVVRIDHSCMSTAASLR